MESEAKQCEIENLQSKAKELGDELQHVKSTHPFDGETSFSSQMQREFLVRYFLQISLIHLSAYSSIHLLINLFRPLLINSLIINSLIH